MKKRFLMAASMLTAAMGLSSASAAPKPSPPPKPNIVLIVLDDVGFSDLGAFGSEIRTPNIDALAAGGLRYNRFDSKAICTATRAALLTGRNNQTVRMADLPTNSRTNDLSRDRGELPANAQLLPQALKAAGYRTYGVGKWHLGPEFEDGSPGNNASWPLQRGFDRFYGFYLGWTDQYHPDLIDGNQVLPKPDKPGYHFSADMADHAIADIDDAAGKPFFLYFAMGAGHAPLQVPRAYIDRYRGVYEKGWDAIRAERFARMQKSGIIPPGTFLTDRAAADRPWEALSEDEKIVFARYMATYAGFLEHADEQIGRVVQRLKNTGLYDNTIIMLISDNGAASEAGQEGSFEKMYRPNKLSFAQQRARIDDIGTDKVQPEYPRPWAWAGDTPLRRYKVWPYAGGVRTPLIVSWPSMIRDGGAVRTQFVDPIDLAPTLLDAAGTSFARTVDGVAQIRVAGQSIRATFRDPAARTRSVQYFELRGQRAITSGHWRAVAMHKYGTDFAKDKWELFDLSKDYSESTDLASRYPAKLEEMKTLWWREARKYSTPPLAEPPEIFAKRARYDDAFADTPK
ncbi:arylsulfatase [Sphingobium sp. BYY-5]|uniref:arylsulfatase n=1 Tax=Sphingobium sp. BYY-5 TaxID=2926400 RepID=UPI001FA7A229|nr:arylsulfatase [Sphingobium sp. BYY-5]MCI4591702.1 arylsulfatase [Sphingobium sp. BYY-5]